MDFSLLTLLIFAGGFVAFVVLAFAALFRTGRESSKDVSEPDQIYARPMTQCYECLGSKSRDTKSSADCASVCGMPV